MGAGRPKRNHPKTDPDFYGTPPWCARQLCRALETRLSYVLRTESVFDPCAGQGHLLHGLRDYYGTYRGDDLYDYRPRHYTPTMQDYLRSGATFAGHVVTNPPFVLYEDFVRRALMNGADLTAMLVRASTICGANRTEDLYGPYAPTHILPVALRPQMSLGPPLPSDHPDRQSSTMDCVWMIWSARDRPRRASDVRTEVLWEVPDVDRLEREGDYFDTSVA